MHAGAPADAPRAPSGAPSLVPQLPIIRTRTEGEQRATFFELFFDLVYVFAVPQLSHHLLADISWSGAAETAFMLVALYWAWNYTTWMTNWFDPDTAPVRLLLAFLSSTALWWLYFGQVAGRVLERIRAATAEERGQIGRDIYTYLHLPIVAGADPLGARGGERGLAP